MQYDYPPTKLFRKLANSTLINFCHTYTDKCKNDRHKRYVSYWLVTKDANQRKLIINKIEFALKANGYSANTRFTQRSLRGTCVL